MLKKLLDESDAVLFDFDGVLVDSEPYYYRSYNMAFEKRGHTIREEDYWEYWSSRGEGIPGEVSRYNLKVSPEEIKVMFRERCEHFTAFCEQGCIRFFPGMLETLAELKGKGMAVAVASSSFEPDIRTIFARAGCETPPCSVVGRRAGLRPKPHPDIFVYAAGTLDVEPARCLAVEDAHKGLEAAKAVGMKCAILKNKLNRNLEYPGADAVVDGHSAFVSQVRSWKTREAG